MNKWFTLSAHDVPLSRKFFVFFERTRDEGPILRAEYRDLACPKCRKFDELAALERGINPEVKLRVQRDAVESEDGILVVSEKSKTALESVPGLQALFFPLPGSPGYYALYPIHLFRAPPDAQRYTPMEDARPEDAFQVRSRPCQECGRLSSVTFMDEYFAVPEGVVLAGAMVEWRHVVRTSWIGSESVANAIEARKLTGWWLHRLPA